MLPSELLVAVFSRNGKVYVQYAKNDCYAAASDLLSIFSQGAGKKRKYLNTALDNYLDQHFGVDARRVRGFFELLQRRCTFSSEFFSEDIQPFEIRKKVFEHAKFTTNVDERKTAMEAAAKELGITADYLLSRMFADMDDEQVITQFDAIDAKTLIKLYNLSLAQTLLFRATEMEFSVSANAREVFSGIKRLGLMYHAYQTDRLYVKLDGPLSVLKLTERYGTSFAKLLPAIVKSDDFNLKAFIVRRKGDVRQYVFDLDAKHKWFFSVIPSPSPSSPASAHEHEHGKEKKDDYDSRVEERFATNFKSLDIGWTLRREPCALITKAGTGVIIPDFVFEKGNLKVYMEIVGFWTENYLKKKFEKLNAVKDRIIVAVDETLACSRLKESENMNLIYFKNNIPMNKIVKILKEYEDSAVQEELNRLEIEQMSIGDIEKLKVISGDVVTVETVAKQFNISPDAARMMEFKGYRLLGDEFISLEKIQSIKGRLGEQTTYSKACEIIEDEGIKCIVGVLQALNYKVEWKNLKEMDALVLL